MAKLLVLCGVVVLAVVFGACAAPAPAAPAATQAPAAETPVVIECSVKENIDPNLYASPSADGPPRLLVDLR